MVEATMEAEVVPAEEAVAAVTAAAAEVVPVAAVAAAEDKISNSLSSFIWA